MKTRHLEADQWLTGRNGVWVPEDGESCHKTRKIDRYFIDINFEFAPIAAVLEFCVLKIRVILCKILDCVV
jgi:hypothetical protein